MDEKEARFKISHAAFCCVDAIIEAAIRAHNASPDIAEKYASAALKFGEALESLDEVGYQILIDNEDPDHA